MTPATRRRYSAVQLALPKPSISRPSGRPVMKPWSSLPPNMRTTPRGRSFSITSDTCSNQLKTSGRSSPLAIRPSTSPIGSIARLSPTARRIDWPGTTTSESPATQTRSGRAGVNFSRAGGCRSRVGHGLRHRDARVDLVVLRAPENRLQPSSRLIEEERSADRRERLGERESDVSLPALRLDLRRLPQPLGVQEHADEEREKRDGDRGARRVQPPALLVDASAGMSSSRRHQNWK